MITLSYAADERIDEFARALAAILRRLLKDKDVQQTDSNPDEEEK